MIRKSGKNNWYKSLSELSNLTFMSAVDEMGDPDYKLSQSALEIARITGVNILRGKELSTVAMIGDLMVGALWIEADTDSFSFDIAVLPKYQNLGIGKKLVEKAHLEYDDFNEIYQDMGEELSLKVHVTNSKMRDILERQGYRVSHNVGNESWIMVRDNEN